MLATRPNAGIAREMENNLPPLAEIAAGKGDIPLIPGDIPLIRKPQDQANGVRGMSPVRR